MKKGIVTLGIAVVLISCGGGGADKESTADSTNINMGSQALMGDTTNQINNRAGSFPSDTSNRSGDDSVSGSNPASRTTTPGNESGQGGRKD